MTDKPDGKRWGLVSWVTMAPPFILLYALSIGPASWIFKRTNSDPNGWPYAICAAIYWPLVTAAQITGTEGYLLWYIWCFTGRPFG
jgi:hypothetical protein